MNTVEKRAELDPVHLWFLWRRDIDTVEKRAE